MLNCVFLISRHFNSLTYYACNINFLIGSGKSSFLQCRRIGFQAEASMMVLIPCMVDVQACLASGVKAEPRVAAKNLTNTVAMFYNSLDK